MGEVFSLKIMFFATRKPNITPSANKTIYCLFHSCIKRSLIDTNSKSIGLKLLFTLLLPDRYIPALEVTMEVREHLEGMFCITFASKRFGYVITSLRCRYCGTDIFVTTYRFFKALFNFKIVSGALFKLYPQLPQNLKPAGLEELHSGQRASNFIPHSPQNFMPSGLLKWHFWHFILKSLLFKLYERF